MRSSGACWFMNKTVYICISWHYKSRRNHAKPPNSSSVFPFAFVSRISPLTLTLPCTGHPSRHPSCLNPGRRARVCEGCSSASNRIRMNASIPSSHRRQHSSCGQGVGKDVCSPALRPIRGQPDASPWKDLSAASAHSHRSLPFLMTGLYTCPVHNHSLKPIPNSSSLKTKPKYYFVVF